MCPEAQPIRGSRAYTSGDKTPIENAISLVLKTLRRVLVRALRKLCTAQRLPHLHGKSCNELPICPKPTHPCPMKNGIDQDVMDIQLRFDYAE